MPELPEVETILRGLAPRVTGLRFIGAEFHSRFVLRANPGRVAAKLVGRSVRALRRVGKFLLFDLDDGSRLSVHLGMTGRLLWDGTPGRHTRAVFHFNGGQLVFDDPRQFGRIELGSARSDRLGPDALDIAPVEFASRLRGRRGRIKSLLLNQRFLAGVGNIYADEALFRARIHPRAVAARLGPVRARRLCDALHEVLAAAISRGGSSISDYVDGDGRPGGYQLLHNVYGRAGEPCPVCAAPVRRIVLAGRAAHFCPHCQKV